MKTKLKYLTPLFFFLAITMVACTNTKQADKKPSPLYPQPQTVEANPTNGYAINPVTGDSIQPIILENGDTLQTGVPIPATGKVINPDSVSQPQSFKVPPQNQLTQIYAHPNVHKIPDELTIIPVNKDSLTRIVVEEIAKNDTTHYIINSIGDTIKTGVPIPTEGKKVPTTQPQPIPALPARFKDNAINNMQYLDVDQGMASSYVVSILEDKNGNIWFGTWGGGVLKYNGKSFIQYTKKNGLSNNIILSIIEDKNGNLWFGTWGGGICIYNGETFTHYTEKEGLSNNYIRSIIEDKKGNIWGCTNGKGVIMFKREATNPCRENNCNHNLEVQEDLEKHKQVISYTFRQYTEKEGLTNNVVLSVLADEKGNIWFGTNGGGVSMFNGKSFTNYTEKEGLSNNIVNSIAEDQKGDIWFGTYSGVSMFNGKSFTNYTEKEGLSKNIVLSVLADKNGNLWFGNNGGGVNMFNNEMVNSCRENKYNHNLNTQEDFEKHKKARSNTITKYTENEGLSNNYVRAIIEDKKGNIWFGTWGGGVSIYNNESFTHYTEKEGLSNKRVLSIFEDKKGNIWFGTNGGGVNMYNGESFIQYTDKDGLSNNIVWSILEDEKGNIWFGTNGGGVSMYNGKSFTHYTEKEGMSNNIVLSIIEDKKGNIWFGTNGGGVNIYNGKFFTHYTKKEGLSNNIVRKIFQDKNGNIWIGTYGGGVSKYNGKTITHYTEKEGLSNNYIWSIQEDKNGNIWFGSYGGGVCKYNGKTFTHYTEKEGLSNNIVLSIEEDKKGNIWTSTENGLTRFIQEKDSSSSAKYISDNKNISLQVFVKNDGLKGMDFYINSVCLDSKNRMWWGSGKSLTMLDVNKFSTSTKPPTIYLTQLDINEAFIDYRNITDSLGNIIKFNDVQRFENYPLNLELPYNKNHLTFHFAAIDWSAPHKIQYSYIMEGLNTSWSNTNNEAKADYRNLPYGSYTFKVRAIGASGEWSEPFEYSFTILPPWWHTWWARTGYSITALLLIFGFVRWRTAKLKERQKELETEVNNATKEIRKQKEEVEEAHKEITDSINYAERIQRSFLATDELLNKNLREYFVFFQPKDVVSGDFYWAGELSNGNFAMVNADSTGHGVPGAIMSILNISSIEKAIDKGLTSPTDIFNDTRKTIIDRLKKDGSEHGGKDGMDASIICFDFKNNKFTYTAAQNPIWVIRDGEVIQIKPEKMPVGKHDNDNIPFTGGEFEIKKGDQIYTLTDGFQDQFGGTKGKKFMIKKMREYVLSISHLPMKEQHQKISEVFLNWKGDLEQVDDVCVIGVKI